MARRDNEVHTVSYSPEYYLARGEVHITRTVPLPIPPHPLSLRGSDSTPPFEFIEVGFAHHRQVKVIRRDTT